MVTFVLFMFCSVSLYIHNCWNNNPNNCYQRPSSGHKIHQIRFRPRLCPRPRWGSSRRSPRPPSRLGRGDPSVDSTVPPLRFSQFKHWHQPSYSDQQTASGCLHQLPRGGFKEWPLGQWL